MKSTTHGYSVVFTRGTRGFTLHPKGVAGLAFFTRHTDAVAWKRDLWTHGRLRAKVVKAKATLERLP